MRRTTTPGKSANAERLGGSWRFASKDVWYHGSPREFESFELQHKHTFGREAAPAPVFLTKDPKFAELYAQGPEGMVYTVEASPEKIFDQHKLLLADPDKPTKYWPPEEEDMSELGRELLEALADGKIFEGEEDRPDHVWASVFRGDYDVMEASEMRKWLASKGYDAFYVTGDGPRNLAVTAPDRLKIVDSRPRDAEARDEHRSFKQFVDEVYDGGEAQVPNPDPDSLKKTVSVGWILQKYRPFDAPHKKLHQEFEKWRERKKSKTAMGETQKTAKAEFVVVAATRDQWPVAPLTVVDRQEALHAQQHSRNQIVLAGFRTKAEAEHFAESVRRMHIDVSRPADGTKVYSGAFLEFTPHAPRLGLRFVDRKRLFGIFHQPEVAVGTGKAALLVSRSGPANVRAGHMRLALATGEKTGDGHGVGLFIPLPKRLAESFPSLGEDDDSPSHVTFLYIGNFPGADQQEALVASLRETFRKWWPNCTATLDGLEYFDHHDKDRRVPHVHVEFDRDMDGLRHRVKQELLESGIQVADSWPAYKPHVTLDYMPGMDSQWEGAVPDGTWTFDSIEVWGLPETHVISFGPTATERVAGKWLRAAVARHRCEVRVRGRA